MNSKIESFYKSTKQTKKFPEVFLDYKILQTQDDFLENLLELWMEVQQAKRADLGDKVLYFSQQAVYSWRQGMKKTKLTGVTIQEEQDLIYFKEFDFDLTFLFELQQSFTQSIVEIFNDIYEDFCVFMEKKKLTNLQKSKQEAN